MYSSLQIEAAAADWLAKRDRGEWSGTDEAELDAWLDASTAHRVAFLRLHAAWTRADRLQALGADTQRPHIRSRARWLSSRPYWGAVAALFLSVAAGLAWYARAPAEVAHRSAIGVVETVPLTDGSVITLNTDTAITVTDSRGERHVSLEQGEALFDVASDRGRPFIVTAGQDRIVVLGTQFSVRRFADGVRVAVIEGNVRMERSDTAASPKVLAELRAGALARSNQTGVRVQQLPLAELEESLSWRAGFLVFRDISLADAVVEFNRYNTREIVIEDPAVAAIRIGGRFRATNVDAFTRLLEQGLAISVERYNDRFVLTRSES